MLRHRFCTLLLQAHVPSTLPAPENRPATTTSVKMDLPPPPMEYPSKFRRFGVKSLIPDGVSCQMKVAASDIKALPHPGQRTRWLDMLRIDPVAAAKIAPQLMDETFTSFRFWFVSFTITVVLMFIFIVVWYFVMLVIYYYLSLAWDMTHPQGWLEEPR